jgi:hypothetical protein
MERFDMLLESLRAFVAEAGVFVPRFALALVVLFVGWLLAKLLRFATVKALRAVNFNVLTERGGLDAFFRHAGLTRDTIDLFGLLVFWLAMVAALTVACSSVGLTAVTALLVQILLFSPKILVALLILVVGVYFSRFVANAVTNFCRTAGIRGGADLGRIARYAIIVFVVLIALDQVSVGGDIVRESFLILLAGIVLAFALAFGLGGRDWAAAVLARWWPPGNLHAEEEAKGPRAIPRDGTGSNAARHAR